MAAISPSTLVAEANCFLCYGPLTQAQLLKLAFLSRILLTYDPMAAVDPQSLLEYAKCFNCYSYGSPAELMELALLDQISQSVTGGGAGGGVETGVGSPEGVVTAAVGTLYLDLTDTDNPDLWAKTTGAGNTGWASLVI